MIFVDTGAWIALLNRRDQYHRNAVNLLGSLLQQQIRLLTTDFVIDETVTRIRYDTNHSLAVEFLNRIDLLIEAEILTVVQIDETVFTEAKMLFCQYDSARLSFTDCTSFVICRANNITKAFAFDRHFQMMRIDLLQ